MLNPFLDNRPIPNIKVNFKVKVKTQNVEETNNWNTFFAYIMSKPKTKIEFITTSIFRNMSIYQITVDDLREIVNEADFEHLKSIENIFNNSLPTDLKAFIFAILQVPIDFIDQKIQQ